MSELIRLCVQSHHPIDPGNYEGPVHCTAHTAGTPCVTALYERVDGTTVTEKGRTPEVLLREIAKEDTIVANRKKHPDGLPLFEEGDVEPAAWLDVGGRIFGATRELPAILFADVPIMLHLTNGYSIAPFSEALGKSESSGIGQAMTLERLAEWCVLANRWEVPAEFRSYLHTINRQNMSNEDAFCLGLYTVLDTLLPRAMTDDARKRMRRDEAA